MKWLKLENEIFVDKNDFYDDYTQKSSSSECYTSYDLYS